MEIVVYPGHMDKLRPGLGSTFVSPQAKTFLSSHLLLSLSLTSPVKRNENILFSLTYVFSSGSVKIIQNMPTSGIVTWKGQHFYKYFWLPCSMYALSPPKERILIVMSVLNLLVRVSWGSIVHKQYCWILGHSILILRGTAQIVVSFISPPILHDDFFSY